MKAALENLFEGGSLSPAEAEAVLGQILTGDVPPETTGAFLGALRMRGERPGEIVGFARALRRHMQRIPVAGMALDTCGTGGDGGLTFNVSTAVGLVVASLGVPVVKHGNRAVSSACGSADVLEALQIPLLETSEQVLAALAATRFGFCFAPAFHPVLRRVGPLRRNLGIRTVFNLLGPLCNPAEVSHQLMGVYDARLTPVLAEALRDLGVSEALVVASEDGLDEISLAAPTRVSRLSRGSITERMITPEDAGLKRASLEGLRGGSAQQNAALMQALFAGEPGPARELVCLNAAAALWISERAGDLREGAVLAAEALDDGRAAALLARLRNAGGQP